MMELDTALHYIFADEAKRPQRLSQFLEFGSMLPWIKRRSLEVQLEGNEITEDQFNERCLISPALVAHATPEQIASWLEIFEAKNEAKLLGRRYWHTGHIEKIFAEKDPTGQAFRDYETLCHATHVSPLGHRLSNTNGPQLFGFTAFQVNNALDSMFGHTSRVLTRIDTALGSEFLKETIPYRLARTAFNQ